MAKKKSTPKKAVKKPATRKKAKTRAPTLPDITKMRGVPTFDLEESVLLVRASCDQVAEALKKRKKLKKRIRNAAGKTITIAGDCYFVYQLRGHPWVIVSVFWGGCAGQDDGKGLSKALATRAIYFGNSDTSCVTQYEVYENGNQVEYFDDFNGIKFHSKLRDVAPPEDGPDVYDFVDAFIREQDAFIPYHSALLFEGWRYKRGDTIKLDFHGALTDKFVSAFEVVSA
jgi:hypothetical protein